MYYIYITTGLSARLHAYVNKTLGLEAAGGRLGPYRFQGSEIDILDWLGML